MTLAIEPTSYRIFFFAYKLILLSRFGRLSRLVVSVV